MRALAALLLAAVGCGRADGPVGEAFAAGLAAHEPGEVVALTELAPFRWDRVHVAGPYTYEEQFEYETGVDWPEAWDWGAVELSDSHQLIVFVDAGVAVAAIEAPGHIGHVVTEAEEGVRLEGASRAEARFEVGRGEGRWRVLSRDD